MIRFIQRFVISIAAYIQPVIAALEPFHSVTIESQILYHAPLKFVPASRTLRTSSIAATGNKVWTVSDSQAGGFVNTEQWTLGMLHLFLLPSKIWTWVRVSDIGKS